MIPTVTVLAERIHRILKTGNVTRVTSWDDRDFQYLIRDEAARQIKGAWYEARKEGQKHVSSQFVSTITIDVLKNNATSENYSEIPLASWLNFADGTGIESVRPNIETLASAKTKDKETRAFIPIPHRFEDLYAGLPAEALEGQFGWKIRLKRLLYTKRYNTTVLEAGITKVDVDVVTLDPTVIDANAVLPISADMVDPLIRNVLALYGIVDQRAKELMAKNA